MRRWTMALAGLVLISGLASVTRAGAELIGSDSLLAARELATALPADQAIREAAVGGKYHSLLAAIRVPADHTTYGVFRDWGHSSTPEWGGYKGLPTGYWVYVYPHWYIWEHQSDRVVAPRGPQGVSGRSWGPEQATGEPDTDGSGDIRTAWASETPDEQDEWLSLEFSQPIIPVAVIVHETFNPGALSRVTLTRPDTEEVDLWKGADPTPPEKAHGVSIVPVSTDVATSRIKLYLDSKRVPGWNEIDAVGLIDQMGKTHWAVRAQASSTFASGPAEGPVDVSALKRMLIREDGRR